MGMKTLRKYKFAYKRFLKVHEFDIWAFSLPSAIEKFYANFPKAKILIIDEVSDEPTKSTT